MQKHENSTSLPPSPDNIIRLTSLLKSDIYFKHNVWSRYLFRVYRRISEFVIIPRVTDKMEYSEWLHTSCNCFSVSAS